MVLPLEPYIPSFKTRSHPKHKPTDKLINKDMWISFKNSHLSVALFVLFYVKLSNKIITTWSDLISCPSLWDHKPFKRLMTLVL